MKIKHKDVKEEHQEISISLSQWHKEYFPKKKYLNYEFYDVPEIFDLYEIDDTTGALTYIRSDFASQIFPRVRENPNKFIYKQHNPEYLNKYLMPNKASYIGVSFFKRIKARIQQMISPGQNQGSVPFSSFEKWTLFLMSFIAVLTIIGPPILDSYLNRVEIVAIERGISKWDTSKYIESRFLVYNNGRNTARNVKIHIQILKGDYINFYPEIFKLIKSDATTIEHDTITKQDTTDCECEVQNLIYECEEFVAGQKVQVYISSDFSAFLKSNELDTLIINQTIRTKDAKAGPFITQIWHSEGKGEIISPDTMSLKNYSRTSF